MRTQMRMQNNKKSGVQTKAYRRRKKYRITSKFRFITSIMVMTCMAIGFIGAVSGLDISRALEKPQYTQVEIVYGDTLWTIADTYKADDTDTRRAIFEICKVNDIEASDLTPGMVISVPQDL